MNNYIYFFGVLLLLIGCQQGKSNDSRGKENTGDPMSNYQGSAHVTQGSVNAQGPQIYECENGRPTYEGVIKSADGKEWMVPAQTNFANELFPFAPDLHNVCNGNTHANYEDALAKLDLSDMVVIDEAGSQFTAYIFADNYFEMYVNGIPVGKDKVPFTPFNSSILRFKVNRPFTIAMKLVDWEEALGLGTEKNRNSDFHAGDGGMVVVITDETGDIIATTNKNWKAQTFYTAPVKDLSCVVESENLRISENCDMTDSDQGSNFYGLHWVLPNDWEKTSFDDSHWPPATEYTNETIGMDNKKAYTNFTDIFDHQGNDAQFIWSTNVLLDNVVMVRYSVK